MMRSTTMLAVAAMTALAMPPQGAEVVPRTQRPRLPPPRLGVYGESASAHDLVRLARKNARRRK